MVFIESFDSGVINEGVMNTIKKGMSDVLKKAGIHVSQGEGLIQQLIKSEKYVSELLYHAFMGYYNYGSEENIHKDKVKTLIKKIHKENLIDFLLRLDVMTMHLVTGPIHMIDALTGTHLWADIKSKVEPAKERARKAIRSLEDLKDIVDGKLKGQVQKYSNALRRVFGVGNQRKIIEEIVGVDISGENGENDPDIKIGDDICSTTGKKKKKCKCKKCDGSGMRRVLGV